MTGGGSMSLEFYCVKEGENYNHFYTSLIQMVMITSSLKDIVKVTLVEVAESDVTENDLYAFKTFEDNSILFIYHKKFMVDMCSPDSFKTDIAEGKGQFVRLRITNVVDDPQAIREEYRRFLNN